MRPLSWDWHGAPEARAAGVLTLALAGAGALALLAAGHESGGPGWALLLLVAVMAAITGASALVALSARKLAPPLDAEAEPEAEAEGNHALPDALVHPEGETVVCWDASRMPRLLLAGISRQIPADAQVLARPSAWLEPRSAQALRPALDRLQAEGKPFNLTATTLAGEVVEVDGRTRGPHAIMRIRDLTEQRQAVADAEERSRRMAKDAQVTRALYEALPVPVWFRGPDGRIDWVNSAYVQAVDGLSREDVRARQLELLETRQRKAVEASLKAGRIHRERVHVFVGGERRSYDLVAVPLDGSSALIANDALALETVQLELTRRIEAHDRTLDRVSTAVADFGPDQRLVYCNEAYRQLWKLDAEWLATHPKDGEILDRLREQRQLPDEADYRTWKKNFLDSYGSTRDKELRWYLPSGRVVHVVVEQRPDGGVTYLYDDATERLALESRFKTAMRTQKGTLDTLREGVAVFATDGRLSLSNPAFARIWKLNPNDLAREPHIDEVVRRCRPLLDDEATWAKVKRAVTSINAQRQRLEGSMQRSDDSVVAFAGLPLPDGAMLLTFVDVTDTARAERMLRERNEALEQADRLKTQFISHVSYELRTPLTNIIGFSEFLESPRVGPLNGKQREYLQDIAMSSKTLLAIIDDILDLATIDAGAFELKKAPLSIEEVIRAAAAGVEEGLMHRHIKLQTHIANDVSELIADENRVKQVLHNLLSNAIGFSKDGGTVGLECRREAGDIVFTVADEGVGIPPEHQQRAFERFVSRAQGSRHRGAGLGLALVKNLVELHGGSVALASEPGKGTTVTVRFPAGSPAIIETAEAAA